MFCGKHVLGLEKICYSNIYHFRNRHNYIKFTRASHQTMMESGRLGKRGAMVSILICEDDEDGVAQSYS